MSRNVEYSISVARSWQRFVSIAGKRVLEIGPGPDLGTGAVLLADGALSYHAVDLFPLAERDLSRFYGALQSRLDCEIYPERLSYTVAGFPELAELPGAFDVVVSHATLEHVRDIPALFSRLRSLVPTGVMCHHVDAMTHTRIARDRDPLNILRFGSSAYRLISFPGVPNRLRASDYALAAQSARFGCVRIAPELIASEAYMHRAQPRLASAYRDRDDLHVLTFHLLTNDATLPEACLSSASVRVQVT